MKILYVTQYFSPKPSHASTVTTYEIVKRLGEKGHEVHVVSAFSPGMAKVYKGVDEYKRVRVLPIPEFPQKWYDGFTTFFTHTFLHVPLVITSMQVHRHCEAYDVIISMFHPTHLATASACVLSAILNAPFVVKIHDFIVETGEPSLLKRTYNKILGNTNRRILRKGNAILVQSPELMNVVKEQAGIDENRMIIFPNGVDTELFRPDIKTGQLRRTLGLDGENVVLFLGGLHEGRHPELLIKALPGIAHEIKHLKLLLVGKGPDKPKLIELAKHLDVNDYVMFLNEVEYSLVPKIISLADVAIGPLTLTYNSTMYGSTPRTVSEYMACGKPAVIPRGAVSRSLVANDYNSVLFEPGDIEGLSSAVVRLLQDQNLRRNIGRNARRHIENVSSWNILIPRLEKALVSLVN